MKKQLLTVLILLVTIPSFAQISFEKGYYIDNTGQKVECFIKNMDWKNNPTEIQYKLTQNAEKKSAAIKDVQLFEIHDASKYERHTVLIDVSVQTISDLGTSEEPMWEERQLFLQVLIEGKASLYSYTDSNLRKYFFKIDDGEIAQLVYKKYLIEPASVGENQEYKKQLWDNLKCDDIPSKKLKNTGYTKANLTKLFVTYNKCANNAFTNYTTRGNKKLFNLSVKPGINAASFSTESTISEAYNISFENKIGFQLGLEAEVLLNFNQNKWALVAEPTYISYEAEQEIVYIRTTSMTRTTNVTMNYSAIEIPIGVRHYFYLNDNSKLFLNAFYMFNITLANDLEAERIDILDVELQPTGNMAFGMGYKYHNKYSVEFRYKTPRNMLPANGFFGRTDYNNIAIIFGYTLF